LNILDRIGGVMVCVLASSAVDCVFEPWLGQTRLYFKHILLSYKTRQMDKTQVVNLWNLLRYIYKH
jgi:hypothetical protein